MNCLVRNLSEKRFKLSDWCGEQSVSNVIDIEKQTHLTNIEVLDLLNEQQSTISRLEEENERLRKETVFLAYWKKKAMTLLMQVRRLTSRMTDKEVKEFSKELEECVSE